MSSGYPEQAEAHHQQRLRMEAANEAFKSTIGAAGAALRVLATVNAGAIIALMGFIGATADKNMYTNFNIFAAPIKAFGTGLLFAVIATAGMFCAQGLFQASVASVTFSGLPPYVVKLPKATWFKRGARAFQIINIACAFASLGLFGYGLARSLDVLSSITVPPTQ